MGSNPGDAPHPATHVLARTALRGYAASAELNLAYPLNKPKKQRLAHEKHTSKTDGEQIQNPNEGFPTPGAKTTVLSRFLVQTVGILHLP